MASRPIGLLESRRAKTQYSREREAERREARVACLLLADELEGHVLAYNTMCSTDRTPERPVSSFPVLLSNEWETRKEALARIMSALDANGWRNLETAYFNAKSVRARLEADGPGVVFSEARIENLRTHKQEAEELVVALYDLARDIEEGLPDGAG